MPMKGRVFCSPCSHIYLQKIPGNVEKSASASVSQLYVIRGHGHASRTSSPGGLCSHDLTGTKWDYAASLKIKFRHPCPVHLTIAKAVIYSARRLLQLFFKNFNNPPPQFSRKWDRAPSTPSSPEGFFQMLLELPTAKADLQTRGSSFLFHISSGPHAPLKGTQGGMKSKQPPQSNLSHAASQPRRFLFLKQKEYSTFFPLSIFLSPSPTSSLLPPGL